MLPLPPLADMSVASPLPTASAPHRQIADELIHFIHEGTLRPGEKLPSVREAARQRRVSTRTVLKAYARLENAGVIEVRAQSGFYVRPRSGPGYPLPRIAAPLAEPAYIGVGDLAADVMTTSAEPGNVPFGWGTPDASLFPNRRIARTLAAVARDDPAWLARGGLNWGYPPLMRAIARRYVHAGIAISHAEVLVTLGCTEALNLCIRAVAKPGDTVAMDTPVNFALLDILRSLGIRVLEIPACPIRGIDLGDLRQAFVRRQLAAVVLMSNHQNPLGCTLSDEHKARLHALLQEFDIPAVEDDVYGELNFHEPRPRPLKAWDVDGRVLLCGSFAKTLTPGFRVGWCAPGRYLEPVRRLKMANTMGTPPVLQKTISDFIRLGGYDRHLRILRRTYGAHVQRYTEFIRRTYPPGTALSQPTGAYILWIQFPAGVDAVRLYREALRHRVSVAPGVLFSAQPRYTNCIRINASTPWSDRIEAALRLLGRLAAAQLRESASGAGREEQARA
jgi:DNA-binding transcriptional MocR family regulator